MGILFTAPQVEFDIIKDEWTQAVHDLARKGVFVGGSVLNDFEARFAAYLKVTGVVGVGNGTDALFLALKALGIGPGDEVITVANTFIATVEAIHHTGATPVLVDCDPQSYLIDLEAVKAKAGPRTKAIIPVHLYGQVVDLDELIPWAAQKGIAVVEDSAQAAGARLRGRAAGSWGVLGCFSFYPDKNFGALGDGGAVTVSSPELLASLRKLRSHGGEARYEHELPGFNSRLDLIQAVALSLKLKYLDEWSAHRRKIVADYESFLAGVEDVILPAHRGDESHVFHVYAIRVPAGLRDELRRHLQKKGILTAIQYPVPIHLTPAFSHLGYRAGDFPHSERNSLEMVSLPMNIRMDEESARTVSQEIRRFMASQTSPTGVGVDFSISK